MPAGPAWVPGPGRRSLAHPMRERPPDHDDAASPTVRLRIDLAYDGAPFHGFARQNDATTVQGELEAALGRVLNLGAPAETTCAGRTDAGVHAEAQTVHLDLPADHPRLGELGGLRRSLDRMLGEAIAVHRVRRVPGTFDARHSATGRRYRYRICDAEVLPPRWRHDTWHPAEAARGDGALDLDAMRTAGAALIGEHDYTSFCKKRLITGPGGERLIAPSVRRIDVLTVRRARPAGLVVVRVEGKAFCHNMVRSITGSLVEVGVGRKPVEWVGQVLAARDRTQAGRVAPARGLCLVGVSYA